MKTLLLHTKTRLAMFHGMINEYSWCTKQSNVWPNRNMKHWNYSRYFTRTTTVIRNFAAFFWNCCVVHLTFRDHVITRDSVVWQKHGTPLVLFRKIWPSLVVKVFNKNKRKVSHRKKSYVFVQELKYNGYDKYKRVYNIWVEVL